MISLFTSAPSGQPDQRRILVLGGAGKSAPARAELSQVATSCQPPTSREPTPMPGHRLARDRTRPSPPTGEAVPQGAPSLSDTEHSRASSSGCRLLVHLAAVLPPLAGEQEQSSLLVPVGRIHRRLELGRRKDETGNRREFSWAGKPIALAEDERLGATEVAVGRIYHAVQHPRQPFTTTN